MSLNPVHSDHTISGTHVRALKQDIFVISGHSCGLSRSLKHDISSLSDRNQPKSEYFGKSPQRKKRSSGFALWGFKREGKRTQSLNFCTVPRIWCGVSARLYIRALRKGTQKGHSEFRSLKPGQSCIPGVVYSSTWYASGSHASTCTSTGSA
jgi:hypothetical protein